MSAVLVLFFFMMVFMDTTATIPTGAMAERWSWKNFCLFGFWVALPYCLYANWVWGGGWFAQGGVNWGLGSWCGRFRRLRRRSRDGRGLSRSPAQWSSGRASVSSIRREGRKRCPATTCRWLLLGTFILAFGWFGFNPGSTLAGTDLRISYVVVNTMLGELSPARSFAMFTLMVKGLKPDSTMMCNGMLAGLVAITAPCAFVDPWAAAVIGAVAGLLVVVSVFFWEKRGIDDPVGAISVHGVNGLWGVISVGIFADRCSTARVGTAWSAKKW